MQLVYLSPVPWASFAQRPHKFVEWFHRRTGDEVLWVDPYPTRFPALSDFRRVGAKVDQQEPAHPSWLRVIRPSALPIEPLPGAGLVNTFMWQRAFYALHAFAEGKDTLLAIGKPSALALAVVNRLKGCRSVYDAMDDFPAFYSGVSRMAMRSREKQLVRTVSTVLVSSTALKRRWSAIRDDVELVHNGLDINSLPAPKPRDVHAQKVLGYVGTIAAWFDWEWVIALAKARPLDVVRLIGPVFCPASKALPQNIEILPPRDHYAALVAMQEFDVGLIPFKKNNLTESVDPIKYYEYRALGLPVLSTDFGEMAFRGGEEATFLSKGAEDIGAQITAALSCSVCATPSEGFAVRNSWEARFSGAGVI